MRETETYRECFSLGAEVQYSKQCHRRTVHSDVWRGLRWEASAFEPVDEVRQGGHSCQSLQGSKRLFKDVSSLKVVMDGSVKPGSPQWLCVCASVRQCVCVCAHLHVSRDDGAKCSAAPSSPLPVCALPSRQPYVKSPLRVPRGCRIYLTCPALKR